MHREYEQELNRQIIAEVRRCAEFGKEPKESALYRKLCRYRTIQLEWQNPKQRLLRTLMLAVCVVGIPAVIWLWAYTIHGYIASIN